MPIESVVYSEVVYLANPDLMILEGQLLNTPEGEQIKARMFVDAAHKIASKNPFASDPKFLDIPIQSMHDETDSPATKLRQEIDLIVRVDFSSSVSRGDPLEVIEIFDPESYRIAEGISTAKKVTIGALGAFTITAATAAGIGLVRRMGRNK